MSLLSCVRRQLQRTATPARFLSTRPTTFADPNRPDLFYHTVKADPAQKPTYALSFLADPPKRADSASIIGWLPPHPPTSSQSAFQGFIQNDKFRSLLQAAVSDGLQKGVDDVWINGALQLQQGWMHVFDQRNIPDLGRIPDVDDIIGTVLVKDSKILAETYNPLQFYRLCTADGITQLTPGLAAHLRQFLLKAVKDEGN